MKKTGRPKGKSPRTSIQIENDRVFIAEKYLQGWTQQKIADHLEIPQQCVSDELKTIRKRWLESSIRDFDEAKSRELARIDLLEKEAWEAWEKSKLPKTTKTHKRGQTPKGDINEITDKVEEREGNKAFLDVIDRCILRRCTILGIDAEIKFQDINLAIATAVRAGFKVEAPRDEINQDNAIAVNGEAVDTDRDSDKSEE